MDTNRFVGNEEWLAAIRKPFVTTRTLSAAEAEEVGRLSQFIAYAVRDVLARVENFLLKPVTFADLVAQQTDPSAAWSGWLAPLRSTLDSIVAMRKSERRLLALLGEGSTVSDSSWPDGHGMDQKTLLSIAEEISAAELIAAPLMQLERVLKSQARKAA
ncbi:MAG TPA: hypothetical protein VK130_08200 [Steroidobacteraceae bacterium]|nr:hypothetical protein [Steroidobacteraceae bacterium]